MCKRYYGNACDKIPVVAVTGTNGKTTTTHILATILTKFGAKPCLIGTNGVFFNGERRDNELTTPDPTVLHEIIANAVKNGATHIIMEASAHALYLDKLYGIKFAVGAFTNFTQDHLDFFADMGSYYKAKSKLVKLCDKFIINCDDEKAMGLYCEKNLTFGFDKSAKVRAKNIQIHPFGVRFTALYDGKEEQVFCSLTGKFNVYNALCAISIALELGVSFSDACSSVSSVGKIDGRFNIYHCRRGDVVIDFAHTEDGLENLLINARMFCRGKLTLVFGCGGNRDKDKRQKMGKVAGRLCDTIFVTNDNPRDEEPYSIIAEIVRGIKQANNVDYYIVPDRSNAIERAILGMETGDVVVIAGKGAEKCQEIRGVKYPYSDEEVVKNVLKGNNYD